MPVMAKSRHDALRAELISRFCALQNQFERRELKSAREGASKGSWQNPDAMCATVGTDLAVKLAVDDFATILKQIKAL